MNILERVPNLFAALLLCFALGTPAFAASPVVQLEIKGAIGPGVAGYVVRGIEQANEAGSPLIVLTMDTPGGLDPSMRDIIRAILASSAPVASLVAPSGARASSAGTYILYASHIAAMAPATNLGAATPVQVGGMPGPSSPRPPIRPDSDTGNTDRRDRDRDRAETNDNAMHHKMVNDASAYLRGLAELRGRNADWAEQAVRQAASLSAREALDMNVIDLLAANTHDLLDKLEGREVNTTAGSFTLHTAGADIDRVRPDWRDKLLAVITDPNVAYILMLLGIYGLFFELANPGFVLPGVIGGICLLLALFAFQTLPVNIAGAALILLGIAFMIGEAFVPSFGALGLGGLLAFVFGSLMLIDAGAPGMGISLPLILGVAASSAAFFVFVIGMALKARHRPVVTGSEEMIGIPGIATGDFEPAGDAWEGQTMVHGETWHAVSDTPLHKDDTVQVLARDGLTLNVEKIGAEKRDPEKNES